MRVMVLVPVLLAFLATSCLGHLVKVDVMDPEFYCTDRDVNEYFRKFMEVDTKEEEARGTCSTYYRCVPSGGNRMLVSKSKCGAGMYFDVEEQVCNMRLRVDNCAKWEKLQTPKPKWPPVEGQLSNCPKNEIECGSGECKPKEVFCDDAIDDCSDGSDENICSDPETDPNAAPRCNPNDCIEEEGCMCSVDGTRIPWNIPVANVPQMITITFSGAVTGESYDIYRKIFSTSTRNKGNGCSVKGTFFVSHSFTNYSAVQELHRLGHEIATNSITNIQLKEYWKELQTGEYADEFDGGRSIIQKFSNISQNQILGMRLPAGRIGGNRQFKMMEEMGFLYDSSISTTRGPFPLWPYSLQYRMPHRCLGIDQQCPTKSFTVYEMVINELDRREDPQFSERMTGCHYIDQCANVITPTQFRALLENNLQHHYSTNRAPLGLHFTASYFYTRPAFLREFISWIRDVSSRGDFFFVTMQQAINWIEVPTELPAIDNYNEWKETCIPEGVPHCQLANSCEYNPPRMYQGEGKMYLHTCEECPNKYPWLHNPEGYGETAFDYIL